MASPTTPEEHREQAHDKHSRFPRTAVDEAESRQRAPVSSDRPVRLNVCSLVEYVTCSGWSSEASPAGHPQRALSAIRSRTRADTFENPGIGPKLAKGQRIFSFLKRVFRQP